MSQRLDNYQALLDDILSGVLRLHGSEPGDEEGNDGGSEGGDNGNETGASGDQSQEKDPRIKQLSDEAASYRVKAKQTQQQLEETLARLKEFEDRDKSETDKIKTAAEEAQKAAEKFRNMYLDTAIRLAVVEEAGTMKFRNPATAARLVDRSALTMDDEGKVEGVQDALKKLAESDPYLLASGSGDEEGDDGKTGGTPSPGGSTNGGRRGNDKGELQKQQLLAKYPALRGKG